MFKLIIEKPTNQEFKKKNKKDEKLIDFYSNIINLYIIQILRELLS